MTRMSQLLPTILINTSALLFTGALMAQTSVPEIAYDSAPNLLKLPEHIYLGEVPGVATNSKGNIFVYTRTGTANATEGTSRTFTHGGARRKMEHAGSTVLPDRAPQLGRIAEIARYERTPLHRPCMTSAEVIVRNRCNARAGESFAGVATDVAGAARY